MRIAGSPGVGKHRLSTLGSCNKSLRYHHFMFDVLVYLYENYWRPDACPGHEQLTRKLTSVGFESDEIADALNWLDGVAAVAQANLGRRPAAGDARDGHRPRQRDSGRAA